MADGILAAYLLGLDEVRQENQAKINSANFAEGDEDEKLVEKFGNDKLFTELRFDVRPEEAVDYFRRKRIVTKETFKKLEREAKSAAFYVADIYREDLLTAFKYEITDALENGQTQKYVTKQFKDILSGAGHKELGDWHLESIARSNMLTAYGVGRRKAMEEVADDLPFWEYSAVDDDRTRPTHRALDGIVYPANHEFWNDHYPPWGFNCRCNVISLPDYPENYDHSKPNSDTTIVYDTDGLPAKAEYLTQVVDLKATKFVGVPKTANLEKALIEAAKAAKDARLLNHQSLPQVIVDKAREIRLKKKESLTGWDKDGNLLGNFEGNTDEVYYPGKIESLLEGGFDIHNHPAEKGFYFEAPSDDDFIYEVELKTKAFYVATQNYLYQIRAPQKGWQPDAIEKFYEIYNKNYDKMSLNLHLKIEQGTMTAKQAENLSNHLIWKEVAKEMKFKYKRFKFSDL